MNMMEIINAWFLAEAKNDLGGWQVWLDDNLPDEDFMEQWSLTLGFFCLEDSEAFE